jgi:hypothetical protein
MLHRDLEEVQTSLDGQIAVNQTLCAPRTPRPAQQNPGFVVVLTGRARWLPPGHAGKSTRLTWNPNATMR